MYNYFLNIWIRIKIITADTLRCAVVFSLKLAEMTPFACFVTVVIVVHQAGRICIFTEIKLCEEWKARANDFPSVLSECFLILV